MRPPGIIEPENHGEADNVVAQRAGTPPPTQVLVSGIIPPLAEPYFERTESGADLTSRLFAGETVVLTPGAETDAAPVTQGGTGKTQVAAQFAMALLGAAAVEILVWVTATSREAVLAGFAQAARAVGADDPQADAEVDAARFAGWLAHTVRPWALVIDDLADLAVLDGLWPVLGSGPAGRVVITTRLPAAAFNAGLRIVPVGRFSRREALSYLGSKLTDYPDQRVEALDLGEDLDGLPLGLAQAAAVMNVNRLSCREYREHFGERAKHMSELRVDGVSAAVLATWSLAAECAHELMPAGLAWPALVLIAMLDPHGIPGAVLTSPAGCGYIAGRASGATAADQNLIRAAITNLARVGLVSIDAASAVRTVRVHPSVQAAVRAYVPPADTEQALVAAADALVQAWPEPGGQAGPAPLDQALRDCAASLRAAEAGGTQLAHGAAGAQLAHGAAGAQLAHGAAGAQLALWQPEAHPVLFRVGRSLEEARLAGSALEYWQSMVAVAGRRLGPGHANALAARDRLATAYESAGRLGDAIAVFASALADRERTHGPEHPDTIAARGRLAHAYASAGRPAEAVALYEHMVAEASRQLGPGHPVTLSARSGLAGAYQSAGRGKESLATYRGLATECQRLLGVRHPTTLAARDSLATALAENGHPGQAVELSKGLLADTEATAGRDHPDTIAARAQLASAYRRSGKLKDAIAQYKRVLEDRKRLAGGDHPDTRTARANLAAAYQQAGRLSDAIGHYELVLADCERMLGPGDPQTLTTRSSLASAMYGAGRLMEAIDVLRRALADSERYLGVDHPMSHTIRDNLNAATAT
jgi:tetratricopeptide (TPR) repeat protein